MHTYSTWRAIDFICWIKSEIIVWKLVSYSLDLTNRHSIFFLIVFVTANAASIQSYSDSSLLESGTATVDQVGSTSSLGTFLVLFFHMCSLPGYIWIFKKISFYYFMSFPTPWSQSFTCNFCQYTAHSLSQTSPLWKNKIPFKQGSSSLNYSCKNLRYKENRWTMNICITWISGCKDTF